MSLLIILYLGGKLPNTVLEVPRRHPLLSFFIFSFIGRGLESDTAQQPALIAHILFSVAKIILRIREKSWKEGENRRD